MTSIVPYCFSCRHFDHLEAYKPEHRYVCIAFPDGIPDKIIYNEFKHTRMYKGQIGDLLLDEMPFEEALKLREEAYQTFLKSQHLSE